jgi:hypothetical protein
MKKLFPLGLVLLGLVLLGAGAYTANRGFEAKDMVRDELIAQKITTPADARIPNVRVDSPATAQAMADIIDEHALKATGGKTYSELDQKDPARGTAFQASALRTSLYTSVMAFQVGDLVIGLGALIAVLGIAIGGVGIALEGLVVPALARRLHVNPAAATA